MSRFESRFRRIEQAIPELVGCPTCRHTSPQIQFLIPDDPEPADRICPDCDRVCYWLIVIGRQGERDDPERVRPFIEYTP
jgi:hypothetical protein